MLKQTAISLIKIANALFFLCCEMNSSRFFLIVGFQLKTNFHTSQIYLKQLHFYCTETLVRRLSFKTQFKIEFLGPFYGPKKSLKKTLELG